MKILEIKDQIYEIVFSIKECDVKDFKKSLIDDYDFDSLMIIDFISEIEEHFNITFDINDEINNLCNDMDLMSEFIQRRMQTNE